MKSTVLVAVLLVAVLSLGAWGQCGCGEAVEPDCYSAFKTTETIEFVLEAPIDYFMMHNTSVSPSIFGWRVETSDGTIVRTEIFPGDPVGRWTIMEWDLTDDSGAIVLPGYYNIIVMTTDSDVAYPVKIVEACRTFSGCFCGCYAPLMCDNPCCVPFGELYLTLAVGETRSCGGLNFSITLTFECEEPPAP
jgi:hypothetical protein